MVRLPDRFDLSGPVSLRAGRQISSADTTAIGRGLQSLGASIQQAGGVAASIAEREKRKQQALDLARANAYQDQSNIELANSFDTDTDYGTFGTRAEERARKIASDGAALISDPETRALWLTQAETTAKAAADGIRDRGVQFKQADDLVKFDEALEIQRRIYVDPNSTPDAKAKARASIEGALEVGKGSGLLDPAQYGNRKASFLEDADFERAKLDTTLVDPRSAYFAAIRSAESGGNDIAQSSTSSAAGRYQFTNDTWDRLVKAYPGAGLTADGRFDPVQQERAIRLFTAENERALVAVGIPATNTALYSAHFLGAGVATKVLKAADGAAVEGLVPPEYVKANPFLKGMTVGQFKAWASEKAGGPGAEPDYVARLSPEQRRTVYDMRDAEIRQAETAAAAEAKVRYAELDGGIGLGILTGDIVSEEQILASALDDADKAKHIRSFRAEQDAVTEAHTFLRGLADGTAQDVNPYSSDDRALVDKSYDLLTKAVPEEQREAAAVEFVRSTGIVPKAVVADVRQSLNAADPATVAAGMGKAALLYDLAPMALDAAENGGELRSAALTYDELVNGRGLSDVQAAEQMIRMRDPKEKQKTETLEAAWKQAVKDNKFVVQDVRSALDTNWLLGEPSAGLTPLQEQGLTADYLAAAERAFHGDAQGDAGLAKTMAVDEIKRTYGVSNVSGGEVIMKYPPEKFFPPMAGGFGYIRDMALKDARTIDPEATNVTLLATTETAQDIRAGKAPRYTLLVQGKDGVWDIAPGLFTVDGPDMSEMRKLESEERAIRFELQNSFTAALNDPANFAINRPAGGFGFNFGVKPGADVTKAVPNYKELTTRLKDVERRRDELMGKPVAETPALDEAVAASDDTAAAEAERLYFENLAKSFGMMGGAAP